MITVNTNMASLIAQNSFNRATNSMNTALNRLSTGYRINSSKDDAAGSAIATKLETKISSYAQATKNAEMGADYLQSADSTLTTMQNMVQRMRDLTEQAANGTYGADERKAIQAEIDGLTQELYRIKNTTEFNGKKIFGEEEQPMLVKPDVMLSNIDIDNITQAEWDNLYSDKTIGISTAKDLQNLAKLTNDKKISSEGETFVLTNDIDLKDIDWVSIGYKGTGIPTISFYGNFDGNNYTIYNLTQKEPVFMCAGLFGSSASKSIKNINLENVNINTSPTAVYAGALVGYFWEKTSIIENCTVTGTIKNNSYTAGGIIGENSGSSIKNVFTDVEITGAAVNKGTIVGCQYLYKVTFENVQYKDHGVDAIVLGSSTSVGVVGEAKKVDKAHLTEEISVLTNLQVGVQADENSVISIDTGFNICNLGVNVTTDEGSRMSLKRIDELMDKITAKKTDIGASLNRLESVMAQQETMRTSMTNALSQIKDADIALESANYVKNQILQQTTASLLATANQNPNIALNLL